MILNSERLSDENVLKGHVLKLPVIIWKVIIVVKHLNKSSNITHFPSNFLFVLFCHSNRHLSTSNGNTTPLTPMSSTTPLVTIFLLLPFFHFSRLLVKLPLHNYRFLKTIPENKNVKIPLVHSFIIIPILLTFFRAMFLLISEQF